MKSGKVLLVDDSEICREVARAALEAKGYEVMALSSPFGFGAALARMRPDIVLVDASMPGLPGDKLIELTLRNSKFRCPFVFYSDQPAAELHELVRSSGAQGFIQKSSDPDALCRGVQEHLARERRAEAARAVASQRASQSAIEETPRGPPSAPASSRDEPQSSVRPSQRGASGPATAAPPSAPRSKPGGT